MLRRGRLTPSSVHSSWKIRREVTPGASSLLGCPVRDRELVGEFVVNEFGDLPGNHPNSIIHPACSPTMYSWHRLCHLLGKTSFGSRVWFGGTRSALKASPLCLCNPTNLFGLFNKTGDCLEGTALQAQRPYLKDL